MATRARIGLELKDGSYISSYQHWDGYPGGLGYNLIDNWNNYDKIEEAIQLGNASKWGVVIGKKHDFDKDRHNGDYEHMNCYYGRDRGEKDQGPKKHLNGVCLIDEAFNSGEEYLYVYRQTGKKDYLGKECGEWFYMKYDAGFTEIAQMKPLEEDAIKEHISMLEYHLKQLQKEAA